MLKQHSQKILLLLALADALAIGAAWCLSYALRFSVLPIDEAKGVPPFSDRYLVLLPFVVIAHLVIFYQVGLYRPRRYQPIWSETRDIFKAFSVAVVAVILIDYFHPATNKTSRQFILTYAVTGSGFFVLMRATVRLLLRALRERGWNQRTAAIVGTGRNAQRLHQALTSNRWTGIDVAYFVDDRNDQRPGQLRTVPVYGPLNRLRQRIEEHPVDMVFMALPDEQTPRLNQLIEALDQSFADVRIVPEVNPIHALRTHVSKLGDVPILTLRQAPLQGWNAVMKRCFDLVAGACFLLIATPFMLLIALAIKLTSSGPVFYLQQRVGLDGEVFKLVKFRTMTVNAEADGAVWSRRADSRRTTIGRFLRRTSLDELPNLFNVVRGDLSLVGPRPERPEFIHEFKQSIPRYMLRHKVKAGMTGFAQVKGLRGDTDLRKRIQHDLHYVRHWSMLLDLRILVQTLLGVWFSKHEA